MAATEARLPAAMLSREQRGNGHIPFRIRIGVTGHKDAEGEALRAVVREQIRRIAGLFRTPTTDVRLAVVSQLAEGADRMVAWEVLEEERQEAEHARLEAFLPFERERYEEVQEFDAESREEFDRLFRQASVPREERGARSETQAERDDAFEAAGRQLVGRCDILIALWDGEESRGRGGTADTLREAAGSAKPCIWICTGDLSVSDNLEPGRAMPFYHEVVSLADPDKGVGAESKLHGKGVDVLAALRESFVTTDRFNRPTVDAPGGDTASELAIEPGTEEWVAAPFARAGELATRWQRGFRWTARAITLCATLAATMLAISLAFLPEEPAWTEAEAVLFFLALIGSFAVRKIELHRRWLAYRVLAEGLRSARFLALTGADFRRQARMESIFADGRSPAWLMRAFEEVWDRRPSLPRPPAALDHVELARLKELLNEAWIGGQIKYHRAKGAEHRRWHRRLFGSVAALFGATIVFAILHSQHIWEEASVFFSIALPAAGASLGVLLTVNQHQALSERSVRMTSDLAVAGRNLRDAPPAALDRVSSEAARVMMQENSAWFGSMWFLDIEHP